MTEPAVRSVRVPVGTVRVESDRADARITVEHTTARVVAVVEQGPPGPPGPAGAAERFEFTQGTPSVEWIINHNLGHEPDVEVLSTGGRSVEADVLHTSANQARVYFAFPFAGRAFCI